MGTQKEKKVETVQVNLSECSTQNPNEPRSKQIARVRKEQADTSTNTSNSTNTENK